MILERVQARMLYRKPISKFTIPILNPSQVLEQVSYWLWQGLRCHLGGPVAGGGTTGC